MPESGEKHANEDKIPRRWIHDDRNTDGHGGYRHIMFYCHTIIQIVESQAADTHCDPECHSFEKSF